MKLWRKLGNKVTLKEGEIPLTGRQFKQYQQITAIGKSTGSKLLGDLVNKVPYVSPYVEEETE